MRPLKATLFFSLSCISLGVAASEESVTYQVCANIPNTELQQFFWQRAIPQGGCQPENHDTPKVGPIILWPHNTDNGGYNNRVTIPSEHFKGKTTFIIKGIEKESERCDRFGDHYVKAKFLIEKKNETNGKIATSTLTLPTCVRG